MKRHVMTFRNTYRGDADDFRCVRCHRMSDDRVHMRPRGIRERILDRIGLLRE